MMSSVSAFARYAQDFFNAGVAGKHFAPAVDANIRCKLACFAIELLLGSTIVNQLPRLVGDNHQLIDTGTATITLIVALLATDRSIHGTGLVTHTPQRAFAVGGRVRALACRAQQAHQTLRQHAKQAG